MRSPAFARLALAAAVSPSLACVSSIDGEVRVDGAAVNITHCDSLERIGLAGVDLVLEDERRIRMWARPGLGLVVSVLESGVVDELGDCAQAVFEEQDYDINDITAVRGAAEFLCLDRAPTIEGRVEFEGCA